jgi:ATP-dependent Clp protease ATP-binding subunit ClpB
MLKSKWINIEISDKATDLLSRLGFDPQYGARPVKRIIQKYILNELSSRILSEQVDKGKLLKIDADGDNLIFRNNS